MTSLERPEALLFLLLPPLAAAIAFAARKAAGTPRPRGDGRSLALGWAGRTGRSAPAAGQGRARALSLAILSLYWAGYSFLALAASGPLSVRRERIFMERGKDLVFVLDVSPSMAARDMGDGSAASGAMSRLDACLGLIRDFAASGGNASLGLVAFGTEAILLLPPTEDREALLKRLEGIAPGMEGGGTALGMGILTAVHHLRSSRAPARAVIVFTDGESNAGEVSPERTAELCRQSGTELAIVAVGRKGEAPLSWRDPETGKAWEGRYVSDFDPRGLEALSRAAGGSFALAGDLPSLHRLRETVLRSALASGRFREGVFTKSLVFPCIASALVLLFVSWSLSALFMEAPTWP